MLEQARDSGMNTSLLATGTINAVTIWDLRSNFRYLRSPRT